MPEQTTERLTALERAAGQMGLQDWQTLDHDQSHLAADAIAFVRNPKLLKTLNDSAGEILSLMGEFDVTQAERDEDSKISQERAEMADALAALAARIEAASQ